MDQEYGHIAKNLGKKLSSFESEFISIKNCYVKSPRFFIGFSTSLDLYTEMV